MFNKLSILNLMSKKECLGLVNVTVEIQKITIVIHLFKF